MWICIKCGERNSGTPDECAACRTARQSRPWEAPPRAQIWLPEPAEPLWIPEPADPGPPEPPDSRLLPALPIAVLVAALVTAAFFGGPRLFGSGEPRAGAGPTAAAAVTPAPAPVPGTGSATPILEDARVGLVTVRPGVDHPRATDVAAMFDTYFTGINERDYDAVAGVLDPDGELNPELPGQLASFAEGTATSRDSDIVLRALVPAASGRLRAEVTFRSEQRAGNGPPERPDEECTRWQVVYVLSTGGDGLRMVRGDGTNEPC